jgi:hypothetical protein
MGGDRAMPVVEREYQHGLRRVRAARFDGSPEQGMEFERIHPTVAMDSIPLHSPCPGRIRFRHRLIVSIPGAKDQFAWAGDYIVTDGNDVWTVGHADFERDYEEVGGGVR